MTKRQTSLVNGARELVTFYNEGTEGEKAALRHKITSYRSSLTHIVAQKGRNAEAAALALDITKEIA